MTSSCSQASNAEHLQLNPRQNFWWSSVSMGIHYSANFLQAVQTKTEALTWKKMGREGGDWAGVTYTTINNHRRPFILFAHSWDLQSFNNQNGSTGVLNIVERFAYQVSVHLQLDSHYLLSKLAAKLANESPFFEKKRKSSYIFYILKSFWGFYS